MYSTDLCGYHALTEGHTRSSVCVYFSGLGNCDISLGRVRIQDGKWDAELSDVSLKWCGMRSCYNC